MLTFQKGDIIIFKAEDDWLSKAIALLTDSDVSHAAMAYSDHSIVEVGAKGIAVNSIAFTDGDSAYIMHLKGEPDPAPLIRSADNYLNAKVRYDFPGLFLLAGLLIYKKITPSSRLLSACGLIFSAAALKLDEFLQQAGRHPDEPAMVCSQLVYQIFYDCGGAYRIKIENGTFSLKNDSNEVRLIDLLKEYHDNRNDDQPIPAASGAEYNLGKEKLSEEYLAKELFEALSETRGFAKDAACLEGNGAPTPEEASNILHPTLALAEGFLSKLEALLAAVNCSMEPESLFVTPADLVYHAENLMQEGETVLKRV